ncbi:MAG: hypothetical protein U1E65_07420 [Myxococcota bacterium]
MRRVSLGLCMLLGCSTEVVGLGDGGTLRRDASPRDASPPDAQEAPDVGEMCPQSCPQSRVCSVSEEGCSCEVGPCPNLPGQVRRRLCSGGRWAELSEQCLVDADGGVPILPACETGTVSVLLRGDINQNPTGDVEEFAGAAVVQAPPPGVQGFGLLFDDGSARQLTTQGFSTPPIGARFHAQLLLKTFPFDPEATVVLRRFDASTMGPGELVLIAWDVSARPLPSQAEAALSMLPLQCGWNSGCEDDRGLALAVTFPDGAVQVRPFDIGFFGPFFIANGDSHDSLGPPRCADVPGRRRSGFVARPY